MMAVGCFFVFGCLRLRSVGFLGVALRGMIGLYLLHFFDNQWVIGGLEHDRLETLLQRLEDDEEGGDDEEKAESAEEHAADSAYADGKKYVYLSP